MHSLAAGLLLAGALSAVACGGDDDKEPELPGIEAPTATATKKADIPRTTPTAVPDDGPAISIVSGTVNYTPTVAQFRALPTTTIKGQTGVSLQALIDAAGLKPDAAAVATIDGTAPGATRGGAVRYEVAKVAANTIFVMVGQGHVNLVSDSIPQEQWLTVVTSVGIR